MTADKVPGVHVLTVADIARREQLAAQCLELIERYKTAVANKPAAVQIALWKATGEGIKGLAFGNEANINRGAAEVVVGLDPIAAPLLIAAIMGPPKGRRDVLYAPKQLIALVVGMAEIGLVDPGWATESGEIDLQELEEEEEVA